MTAFPGMVWPPTWAAPMYNTLWNGDTAKPAGGIFISPLNPPDTIPILFGPPRPDNIPTADPNRPPTFGPERDGVWWYDCSAMSLPSFYFGEEDIKNGRIVTTRKGRTGHLIVEIIELITKLLTRQTTNCQEEDIAIMLGVIKELKNKLNAIGITISEKALPSTTEGVREAMCGIPAIWVSRFEILRLALKELINPSLDGGTRPDLEVVWAPWGGSRSSDEVGENCTWVFLGWWKRGKFPRGPVTGGHFAEEEPLDGSPPPAGPGPNDPHLDITIGVSRSRLKAEIVRIRGNGEHNNGKKYTLGRRSTIFGPRDRPADSILNIGVKPSLGMIGTPGGIGPGPLPGGQPRPPSRPMPPVPMPTWPPIGG